jgi:hypothetical protein
VRTAQQHLNLLILTLLASVVTDMMVTQLIRRS